MSKADSIGTFILFLVACIFICSMSVAITATVVSTSWEKECIKRDYAEYNPKTGQWQWKENQQ